MEVNSAKIANGGDEKRSKMSGHGGSCGGGGTASITVPEEILMDEILPRLPVKSLVRFKSVSKLWYFTICKNPKFAHLHLKFSSLLRRQFFMMSDKGMYPDFYLSPYRETSNLNDLVQLIRDYKVQLSAVVGSFDGLVCICNHFEDRRAECASFDVWNPATRESRKIESPPGVYMSGAFGFGYVSSIDDYVIAASFLSAGGQEWFTFRGFYVFSLRVGEWKRVAGRSEYSVRSRKWTEVEGSVDQEILAMKLSKQGVLVDQTLYWPPYVRFEKHVVGFDLASEVLKEYTDISWDNYGYDKLDLFRLEGCLALHGSKVRDASDFWVLKNVNDWSSWQRLFSVNLRGTHLIALSETRKCMVRRLEQLKLVEMCKETLDCTQGDEYIDCLLEALDHVESLISPFRRTTKFDDEQCKS